MERQSTTYSTRLGPIHDDQLRAALRRFDLGDLVSAAPTVGGLFGQNVFVTSTRGEYVLRGCPHSAAQFPKEKFFADALHERTAVPVPWPYLHEPATDLFGWAFVVMPRLPGVSPYENRSPGENLAIARALGENLAAVQALTFPAAGEYDLAVDGITPYPGGYAAWVKSDMAARLEEGRRYGCITDDDETWVSDVMAGSDGLWGGDWQPCFVQTDYQLGNMVVRDAGAGWRVSGLYDLYECRSGDGESDLVRVVDWYLGSKPPNGVELARAFVEAYCERRPLRPGYNGRHSINRLRNLMIFWLYGHSQARWYPEDKTLRSCFADGMPPGLDVRLGGR